MSYPPEGPCEECGAMVGHRMIPLETVGEGGTWETSGHRTCSLGMDVVPRAEHERVKEELEDAKSTADAWERECTAARGLMVEAEIERDEMLVNLTSTQARCTELLKEVRALRMANDWRDGLRNGPQSALDILGIDRDRWKARAVAAEKERDQANRRSAEIPSGDTEEVRALRVERDGLRCDIARTMLAWPMEDAPPSSETTLWDATVGDGLDAAPPSSETP